MFVVITAQPLRGRAERCGRILSHDIYRLLKGLFVEGLFLGRVSSQKDYRLG